MSQIIYAGAGVTVPVAVNDEIALYSEGPYRVSVQVSYPNQPASTNIIADVQSGAVTTAAFTVAQDVTIVSEGVFPVYYEVGTAAVVKARGDEGFQGDAAVLNVTGALTSAMILAGIVTSTTAAAVDGTLPTGTVLANASSWSIGDSWDWSVVNTGGFDFTLLAAANHTVVGNVAVIAGTTGRFRTVCTAATTFVTYTLANGA